MDIVYPVRIAHIDNSNDLIPMIPDDNNRFEVCLSYYPKDQTDITVEMWWMEECLFLLETTSDDPLINTLCDRVEVIYSYTPRVILKHIPSIGSKRLYRRSICVYKNGIDISNRAQHSMLGDRDYTRARLFTMGDEYTVDIQYSPKISALRLTYESIDQTWPLDLGVGNKNKIVIDKVYDRLVRAQCNRALKMIHSRNRVWSNIGIVIYVSNTLVLEYLFYYYPKILNLVFMDQTDYNPYNQVIDVSDSVDTVNHTTDIHLVKKYALQSGLVVKVEDLLKLNEQGYIRLAQLAGELDIQVLTRCYTKNGGIYIDDREAAQDKLDSSHKWESIAYMYNEDDEYRVLIDKEVYLLEGMDKIMKDGRTIGFLNMKLITV